MKITAKIQLSAIKTSAYLLQNLHDKQQ